VIRAERGVRLNAPLAGRVNAAISAEPTLGVAAAARAPARPSLRWWQPLAGAAMAAGVAATAVLWLRAQGPAVAPLTAQHLASPVIAPLVRASTGLSDPSYVTPRTPAVRPMLVPSTQLANYVVAHSMVSSPVAGRNLLSAFISSESPPAVEDVRVNVAGNAK
jgi:hypothetical protein